MFYRMSTDIGLKLIKKHPSHIPVIFICSEGISLLRSKYLINRTSSFSELLCSVRSNISLQKHEAIFCFVNNTLCPNTAIMGDLYDQHFNENDHILYISIVKENTFG